MNCCQKNSSSHNESHETDNKVSWKSIIVMIIILIILFGSLLSIKYH